MTVVSNKEFVSNDDKYLDLALNEQIAIKRGANIFYLIYHNPADETLPKSRQGWAECAKEFVKSGNEETFFPDFFEDEDLNWWQWKQE